MTAEEFPDPWTEGWYGHWPALVDRVEIWHGRLMYEIRGFRGVEQWTEEDLAIARRTYPDRAVYLSPGRTYLVVEPPADDPVHQLEPPDFVKKWRDGAPLDPEDTMTLAEYFANRRPGD